MDPLEVAGLGLDAFKLAYNIYTNKRDFDYQKALQQQVFDREDNAVQRRMADLQAAGLNPNLAAGSAAGAGSVVSRSNTNDLGSVLDTMMAINSIKQQKQAVQNAKKEYEYLAYQTAKYQQDWAFDRLVQLKLLGFNPRVTFGKDGKIHNEAEYKTNSMNNTPLGQMLDYEFNNLKNSSSLIEKQNDWYTANQILAAVGSAGNLVIGGTNAYSNYKKAMRWR